MGNITGYNPELSPCELLGHLCDKVLSGELATFEELRSHTAELPDSPQLRSVLKRVFELQRRLDWGFFKSLSPEAYPRLWAELVVPDRRYPFAGDLKRLMSISEIYLGFLDMHGYTEFCRKNRNNVSLLDRLDRLLQEGLPEVAAASGVLCRRAQGDEILLLGASALDVLKAVLDIMACFSGEKIPASASPAAEGLRAAAMLPEFAISAGIAGGQKYTPLVITRDGDISGDIVNTAARLQARAGKISPTRDKILATGPVYQKLKAEGAEALAMCGIDFISSGRIEFKGASLTVYDAVFLRTEEYRLAYRDAIESLYGSMGKDMWKSKVFEDSAALVARVASNHPGIGSTPGAPQSHSVQEYLERVKQALGHFNAERYEQAVACLGELVDDLATTEGMDELALEYLRGVRKSYQELARKYGDLLDEEMDKHLDTVLGQKEMESYLALRRNHAMFERLRNAARLSIKNRRAIWQRVAEDSAPELSFAIQSFK
jgi:class 3 adenylate cyclase